MALKVKAKEKLQKIGKYADSYRYVMMPELYSTLDAHSGQGHQGLGHRGSLCCPPRPGNHALRPACQKL